MKNLLGYCLLSLAALAGLFPGAARAVVVEHEYDAMNRRILTRYEDGGTVARAYDPAGNLTRLEKHAPGQGSYLEDFEGPLGPEWSTYTSSALYGRSERSSYSAGGGGSAWRMDVTANGNYSLNELVLRVRVSGATYLKLSFATREYYDEQHRLPAAFSGHTGGDGIAVSSDGANWKTLWQYPSSVNAWTAYGPIDLSALLSLDGDIFIRFQQYDNGVITTDGILWDDILLTSDGGISLP